jgi:L-serine dehydratase
MKAAFNFLQSLSEEELENVNTIKADLYGSLALTGKGHGTDKAIILGLMGFIPETINSNKTDEYIESTRKNKVIKVSAFNKTFSINFKIKDDIKFHRRVSLPFHPNGMAFAVFDKDNAEIKKEVYYSIGGGFILTEDEAKMSTTTQQHTEKVEFPFNSADELMELCKTNNLSIPELMMRNELTWKTEEEVNFGILKFWKVMEACVQRGFINEGILPGGLKVKRRAPGVYQSLVANPEKNLSDVLSTMDWVNLYALSVNEENAAGGQVVTAPTNGAAGIIPAVLHYYVRFTNKYTEQGVIDFLLTAAAIAMLYKKNASISGAEVGCQGEVGVACSMAAGALTQVLGGTIGQVENAAEIGMEHNLGLTCDPIGGLVQIPCIERNAMGAIKAINATRIALKGDGTHFVSLDKVIRTMKRTGMDMKKHYKETSKGGLAVNITEC